MLAVSLLHFFFSHGHDHVVVIHRELQIMIDVLFGAYVLLFTKVTKKRITEPYCNFEQGFGGRKTATVRAGLRTLKSQTDQRA